MPIASYTVTEVAITDPQLIPFTSEGGIWESGIPSVLANKASIVWTRGSLATTNFGSLSYSWNKSLGEIHWKGSLSDSGGAFNGSVVLGSLKDNNLPYPRNANFDEWNGGTTFNTGVSPVRISFRLDGTLMSIPIGAISGNANGLGVGFVVQMDPQVWKFPGDADY